MIILDMDMPKSCEECSALHRPYSNIESTFCHLNPYEWIKVEDITKKPDTCPIKCDIENIKTEIKNERDDIACGVMAKYSSDEAYYNALGWVLNIIDKYINGDMGGGR